MNGFLTKNNSAHAVGSILRRPLLNNPKRVTVCPGMKSAALATLMVISVSADAAGPVGAPSVLLDDFTDGHHSNYKASIRGASFARKLLDELVSDTRLL